ncbi:DUF7344 domain-containing protein [Halomicrococcus sp. SG-WS-1]|uniref:DUF7344 domain-containing protein n=1 Tax=Halomicrococcus sp. SG-WS-1 TaxID=3439057 RepID=UPI003F7A1463
MTDTGSGRDEGEGSSGGTSFDELLEVVADQHRRFVLYYLQDTDGDVASFEELREHLLAHDLDDSERATIALHHRILPRLEDAGLVEYDARSDTVRYREDDLAERLLDRLADVEKR